MNNEESFGNLNLSVRGNQAYVKQSFYGHMGRPIAEGAAKAESNSLSLDQYAAQSGNCI